MADEFFYLGQPPTDVGPHPDAFTWAFMNGLDKMQHPDTVKVAYDYSEEFRQMLGFPLIMQVTCRARPADIGYGVEFIFGLVYNDRRYQLHQVITSDLCRNQDEFDRWRVLLFSQVVRKFVHDVMDALYPEHWKGL